MTTDVADDDGGLAADARSGAGLSPPPTVVLLPSVFLGPVSVEPLAAALRELGYAARVADPAVPRSAAELSGGYRAALPRDRPAVVVPHSNAGLFAPGLLEIPTVRGAVFLDALLPPAALSHAGASAPVVPAGLRSSIPEDSDGSPLAWPFWWDLEAVRGLYPDDGARREVERRAPRPEPSLLSSSVRVPPLGDARGGYVAFGDSYRADRDRAGALGWPTRVLDGGHLHLLVDPAGVAAAVIDVASRAGLI